MSPGVHVGLHEELLSTELGCAVQIGRAHCLVRTERYRARHMCVNARFGDVLRAEDVRLDRFERVVLAYRNVFERSGVYDNVGASDGPTQPIAIADIADEETETLIIE